MIFGCLDEVSNIVKFIRRSHADDSFLNDRVSDPVIRQILASRGIKTVSELDCELKDLLHYKTLLNIGRAAELIADAIQQGTRILVAGDYDVDGVTGTVIGVKALKALGASAVDYFVPSRYDEGYGLSVKAVMNALSAGTGLILTVDNGISCLEPVNLAVKHGLKVVVTDHHESEGELPRADAVVDPKLPGDQFPSKSLCGAGVLFYVLAAVRAELRSRGFYPEGQVPMLSPFLDLVALGTIGDVMDLDVNNRRLIKAGITIMREGRAQPGITALARRINLDLGNVFAHNLAFELCPRINAAGRIPTIDEAGNIMTHDINPAVRLLLTDSPDEAAELADRLFNLNLRRGDHERVAVDEATEDALAHQGASAITLYRPYWLVGIVGLVAGRIKDKFQVPVFVFAGEGSLISGSARSVPGFPMADILQHISEQHPGLLVRFGGHAMAAGATIRRDRLEEFRDCFNAAAKDNCRTPKEHEVITDGVLSPERMNLEFLRALEQVGPWGNGFPVPVFEEEFVIRTLRRVKHGHLKLSLYDPRGRQLEAMRFWPVEADLQLAPGSRIRAAYSLGVDRYRGEETLELKIIAMQKLQDSPA